MRLFSAIRATVGILLVVPLLSGCGTLGLTFVEGPAPGWQDASAEDLEAMALTQPCTNSKFLPRLDAINSVANGVFGIVGLGVYNQLRTDHFYDEKQLMYLSLASLAWAPLAWFSSKRGNAKVNDCRAFGARLVRERRAGTVAQATYNWLDEFSPVLDFGVASQDMPAITPPVWGFRSVFSGPISNSPEQ